MRAERTCNVPPRFMVPPITAPPSRLGTGAASPVSMLSSAWDMPDTTVPSTGMRAPGSTWLTTQSLSAFILQGCQKSPQ